MGLVEVRTEHIGDMQHRASARRFAFSSDEPSSLGGSQAHPLPLAYFTASIGMCAMTQVVRFAEQMKVDIGGLSASVLSEWDREGSVLAGTVRGRCLRFTITLDIASSSRPDHVAALVQNAHAGCFAEQALIDSVVINSSTALNGVVLDSSGAPKPTAGAIERPTKHFPIEVSIVHTGGVAHEARWGEFTFTSDEPPHLGGQDAHPIPIEYFVASVGFCVLTQIKRYAKQLKIPVEDVSCSTASHFSRTGSVLAGTVAAKLNAFDVKVDITSPAPPADIQNLLAVAHAGCYAQQALLNPVTIESRVRLNGEDFDPHAFPRRVAQ